MQNPIIRPPSPLDELSDENETQSKPSPIAPPEQVNDPMDLPDLVVIDTNFNPTLRYNSNPPVPRGKSQKETNPTRKKQKEVEEEKLWTTKARGRAAKAIIPKDLEDLKSGVCGLSLKLSSSLSLYIGYQST